MASVSSVISKSAQRFRLVNSKVGEGKEEGGQSWEDVCACMNIVGGDRDLGWPSAFTYVRIGRIDVADLISHGCSSSDRMNITPRYATGARPKRQPGTLRIPLHLGETRPDCSFSISH